VERAGTALNVVTIVALATGVAFLFAPAGGSTTPGAMPASAVVVDAPAGARAYADSLAEDIIFHNLFAPSRSAPPRRYAGPGSAGGPEPDDVRMPETGVGAGFTPVLHGTVVSDQPERAKVLLQLDPTDASPRLYGIGEGARGYTVLSIEPRSVTLRGPRGRVVIRLPENREDNS
jgi:hypothetical protein